MKKSKNPTSFRISKTQISSSLRQTTQLTLTVTDISIYLRYVTISLHACSDTRVHVSYSLWLVHIAPRIRNPRIGAVTLSWLPWHWRQRLQSGQSQRHLAHLHLSQAIFVICSPSERNSNNGLSLLITSGLCLKIRFHQTGSVRKGDEEWMDWGTDDEWMDWWTDGRTCGQTDQIIITYWSEDQLNILFVYN